MLFLWFTLLFIYAESTFYYFIRATGSCPDEMAWWAGSEQCGIEEVPGESQDEPAEPQAGGRAVARQKGGAEAQVATIEARVRRVKEYYLKICSKQVYLGEFSTEPKQN
jgi:hypothetical protein